jgi:hypothetical protein
MSEEMITIKIETLKALFDLAAGSMNYSSGFLDRDEVDVIMDVANLLGADDPGSPAFGGAFDTRYRLDEPHLWHQDCTFPWRCGKPQNDPIHRPELPK